MNSLRAGHCLGFFSVCFLPASLKLISIGQHQGWAEYPIDSQNVWLSSKRTGGRPFFPEVHEESKKGGWWEWILLDTLSVFPLSHTVLS